MADQQAARKRRATDATYLQRVHAILQLRLDGAEGWHARRFVAEMEQAGEAPWKIPEGSGPLSERQVRNLVADADALIAESFRPSWKRLLNLHVARRNMLYARAVQAGELRTALAVLEDLATLQGLYPAKKVKAERSGGTKLELVHEIVTYHEDELTDEQRNAALDNLNARLGNRALPSAEPCGAAVDAAAGDASS